MTDKTPQKKAENTMNNPAELPKTTDTKSDSGPQSNALTQANELKERFKAGSIPLQTDFANLIDMANIGLQAVGGAEGQTGPANGFTLSTTGRLELKPKEGKGISVDQDGVAVKIDETKGVQVSGSGIGVKLYPDWGLEHDNLGIWVKVNKNKGVSVDKDGVQVISGNGIQINTRGVSIKLADNSGLSADETNGLKIVPEQTFQKGMVMMFSGTSIPSGWALCDGSYGTPNLIDRFIIGGKGNEVGKTGGQSLTGSGSNKTYTVNTNFVSAGKISVIISGTALEAKHIPPHTHNVQYTWNKDSGVGGRTVFSVANEDKTIDRRELIDAYGNPAEKHTHTNTATQGVHGHTINSLPAYYILAFIMKL
ncbi:phage tail protein [Photorhabdus kleinii]|uniref:phage tail protein n=1 Tax=Photorhabdus kleinii TaxID=768034 RepID=UPI0021D4B01C|nr:phage tail protein [Photorhabdus kleinii]MCT8343454.1 phage tail protein [Photorhabdus kleinii]